MFAIAAGAVHGVAGSNYFMPAISYGDEKEGVSMSPKALSDVSKGLKGIIFFGHMYIPEFLMIVDVGLSTNCSSYEPLGRVLMIRNGPRLI